MYLRSLITAAGLVSFASAQVKGFNYASTLTDGSAKSQAVFEAEFAAAKALPGGNVFNSARLYTCVQAGTTNTPILAIPAAIAQDTTLLLGLWASAGQASFSQEIAALTAAISQYGTAFTSRVVGISVGSEDLYRTSTIGIAAEAGVGTTPDVLVNYISQVRTALAGTALSSTKITHVDTYNAYTNSSNSAVINAIDFISIDAYPYFQTQMANAITNGASLFNTAYEEVVAVAGSKEIWVTETGWPVSGANQGAAVASVANAKTYWDDVGCGQLFGKVNTYWYILQDAIPTLPSPSFGIVGAGSVSQAPLFNLTCPAVQAVVVPMSSAAASSAAAAVSSSAASPASSSMAAAAAASSSAVVGRPVILPGASSKASSSQTTAVAKTSAAGSTHTAASSSSMTTTRAATTSSTSPVAAAAAAASSSVVRSSSASAASDVRVGISSLALGLGSVLVLFMTL